MYFSRKRMAYKQNKTYVEIHLHVTFSWRSRRDCSKILSSIEMPNERDFFNNITDNRDGKVQRGFARIRLLSGLTKVILSYYNCIIDHHFYNWLFLLLLK